MSTTRLAVALALACLACVLVLARGDARAARSDWTGSAKCGSCHPKHLAAWLQTPHATTAKRFTAKPEARCLACHGTGDAPAGPTIAVEVGCESCHGAGAAYAEDDVMRNIPVARALGLVDTSSAQLRAKLCMSCHARGTTSTFDPTAPVHRITP